LNRLCRTIARKNLYHDAPSSVDKAQWRREYEDAVRVLEDLAQGDVSLGEQATAARSGSVSIASDSPVFDVSGQMNEW